MSPQKSRKRNPADKVSDEVTEELQQIADENAALKKLLEIVGGVLPEKVRVKPPKGGESSQASLNKNDQ